MFGSDKVLDYTKRVKQTCSILLMMLDEELIRIEKQHKTGSPYWKRLRVRKRLVQSILTFASEEDFKVIREKLREEFFRTPDKVLV
jgi:hypothetical protein